VLINWAIVFAIISVSILVLVLSYKLFGVDSIWSKEKEIETSFSGIVDEDAARDLREISETNSDAPVEYTVFYRMGTESGEIVVTGREFAKENLSVPTLQYCYLESGSLQGIPMAEKVAAESLTVETKDPLLIRYVESYCKFY